MKSFILLVPTIFAVMFFSCENKNTLKHFHQSGRQTLIEVTDKKGGSWKIHSVAFDNVKTLSVFKQSGQAGAMAFIFPDSAKASNAVLFTDVAFKGRGSSLLQKEFLSNVTNASREYRNWVNQFAVFTDVGGGPKTHTIEVRAGALGSADVRVEDDKIVGLWTDQKCHCGEIPCSPFMSSVGIDCINRLCDLANCIGRGFERLEVNCGNEAAEARLVCELFFAEP